MNDPGSKIVQRLLRYYGSSCVLAGPAESYAIARQWQASQKKGDVGAGPLAPDYAALKPEHDKSKD